MLPCERAQKAGSETAVKSDLAFCLGPFIEKTNSDLYSHPSHFPPTPIPKSQSKETFRASSIDIEASAADWQGKAIQQDKAIRCHDTGKPLIIDFSIKTT